MHMGQASTEPTNTSKTYLKHYNGTAYADFIRVKSVPDLGSEPSKLDSTDLSSERKQYTQGLQDSDDMKFIFNYTKDRYDQVRDICDGKIHYFRIDYGTDGIDGMTYVKGTPYVYKNASEVDSVREATFGITVADISDTTDLKTE